ncbi:uncharacterized protein BDZ99DRAFT_532193 [Mytilinidion resinicola]|uniref:Uncharacterized protein n=1 Tax=Mytilinidion resinicola TaxID=574789 RepID=A0A6A6YM88_9PEZI|nr:uncharacterized protein BDZ99DRAFT_532193 [Mytilinidion resinicola]KAF2809648.1 hypothetical protein BDZ99DRAFT_532193 [Mytilinidion resinicola]
MGRARRQYGDGSPPTQQRGAWKRASRAVSRTGPKPRAERASSGHAGDPSPALTMPCNSLHTPARCPSAAAGLVMRTSGAAQDDCSRPGTPGTRTRRTHQKVSSSGASSGAGAALMQRSQKARQLQQASQGLPFASRAVRIDVCPAAVVDPRLSPWRSEGGCHPSSWISRFPQIFRVLLVGSRKSTANHPSQRHRPAPVARRDGSRC